MQIQIIDNGHPDYDLIVCPGEHLHTGMTKETDCRRYRKTGIIHCMHSSCAQACKDASDANRKYQPKPKLFSFDDLRQQQAKRQVRDAKAEAKAKPVMTLDDIVRAAPAETYLRDMSHLPLSAVIAMTHGTKPVLMSYGDDTYRPMYTTETTGMTILHGSQHLRIDRQANALVRVPLDQFKLGNDGKGVLWHNCYLRDITGCDVERPMPGRKGEFEIVRRWRVNPNLTMHSLVLEMDDPSLRGKCERVYDWLISIGVPIWCVTESGGKSLHALVRVPDMDHAQYTAIKDIVCHRLGSLGFDMAALTFNRWTRCPNYRRGERMQALRYVNPKAYRDDPPPVMDWLDKLLA